MYPISDELIAFYVGDSLPTVDIFKDSWDSLESIRGANELHWSNHLKQFLVLKYSGHITLPNQLYQFDPYSGKSEEILIRPRGWKSSWNENFTTLTCFEKHVLIVLEKTIEKWSAHNSEWHKDEQPSNRWRPPISCHSCDKINCIRMNDQYYALIIERVLSEQGTSISVFYFELRTHGMSTLRRIETDYDKSPYGMRLLSLPNESGWLFFFCGENKEYCYILDNDGKRYDQNTVISSNVIDIAVQNNIILLRKIGESYDNNFVEVYVWQKLG